MHFVWERLTAALGLACAGTPDSGVAVRLNLAFQCLGVWLFSADAEIISLCYPGRPRCDAATTPGCCLALGVLAVSPLVALVWLGTPCMNHPEAELVTGNRADKQIRPLSFSAQSYPFQCRPRICRSLPQNSNSPGPAIGSSTRAQRLSSIPSILFLDAWLGLFRNARLFSTAALQSVLTPCQPVKSALCLVEVYACTAREVWPVHASVS